jgi:hypothetical protein
MSLLEEPQTTTAAPTADREPPAPKRDRPLTVADAERHDIDRTGHDVDPASPHPDGAPRAERPVHGPVQVDPSGRLPWRGMRIRRVRLTSVATLAAIFWALAFAILLGSALLVWNVARAFGFISEIEEVVVTSLGLDAFEIDGGALFGIAAVATAFLTTLGWFMTVLMAAVYNASCAVFGGLAVETGPLRRRHRVFSLRHRRFVTIRS